MQITPSQVVLVMLALLFAYPFVLYPVVLSALASGKPRRRRPAQQSGPKDVPEIAFIICALNEERVIRQKILNSLELHYPKDQIHIVVVSDGSTDATASIAREFIPAIELIERSVRRGKVTNLNEVIALRTEPIIVLSDANVMYDSKAIGHLIARFEDPSVGCVSGKVILVDTTDTLRNSEEQYYSVEWTLQEKASFLYSMVSADGAMYAIRKELFRPCPNDTLIEDFVMSIDIIRQGRRVVFEPSAVAWESGVTSLREEFRRKVRIAAGAIQALLRGNGWPKGAPAAAWFIFVSHKLLRWLSPLIGLLILGVALASKEELLSRAILGGFAVLLTAALLRWLSGWKHTVLDAPFYFLFGQTALLWGLLKGAAGKQSVLWAKANR
jgi:cellulose synthase/poly-beta-1,6-N-acetylglucosamine synthase-like glycosyltransferase